MPSMGSARLVSERLMRRSRMESLDDVSFPHFVRLALERDIPSIRVFGANEDGGIDLFAEDEQGGRIVYQCKYLKSPSKSPLSAWREERKKLARNLILNGGSPKEVQFSPWFNNDRPITKYVFCYSRCAVNLHQLDKNAADSRALECEIQALFELLSKREGLDHLASIRIEALCGDKLLDLSASQEALEFKIFGPQFPAGILEVDADAETSDLGFISYLTRIPYFSRTAFNARNVSPALLREEADIIEELLYDTAPSAVLLITGPGGFGKTRLALELTSVAKAMHGTLCFRLSNAVTAEALVDLHAALPAVPVIFLIDYLESQGNFEVLLATIMRLNALQGNRFRVIATCRSSYYRKQLIDSDYEVIDLADQQGRGIQVSYREFVFKHILDSSGYHLPEEFGVDSGYNPVIAALLVYLGHSGGKAENISQMADLIAEPRYRTDLARLLIRRSLRTASATLGTLTADDLVRQVAPIMASLPLRPRHVDVLRRQGNAMAYFDLLVLDRLIEQRRWPSDDAAADTRSWAPAHDIVADYFLIRLLGASAITEAALETIFELAACLGTTGNALMAIQRIADTDILTRFSYRPFLERKIRSAPIEWRDLRIPLLRSGLLGPRDKIAMMASAPTFWLSLRHDKRSHKSCLLLAAAYRRQCDLPGEDDAEYDSVTLLPYLEEACATDSGYAAISRALRYNPAQFAERAKSLLATRQSTPEQHFLIVAWLSAGLPLETIQAKCLELLRAKPGTRTHQFILHAVLDYLAKHDRVSVQIAASLDLFANELEFWLTQNAEGKSFEARFVLGSWLLCAAHLGSEGAGIILHQIVPVVCKWIKRFSEEEDSQYVMASWLRAAGVAGDEFISQAFETLREPSVAWLDIDQRATTSKSTVLMSAWLLVGRGQRGRAQWVLTLLHPYLVRWVDKPENHDFGPAAYFYHDWLRAARSVGPVVVSDVVRVLQPAVARWFRPPQRATTPEAEFIYVAWLLAAQCSDISINPDMLSAIESSIEKWIALHGSASPLAQQWQAAVNDPSNEFYVEHQFDLLFDIVRKIRADRSDTTISDARTKLLIILGSFVTPREHSRTVRNSFLFKIFRIFDELVEVDALIPTLAGVLPAIELSRILQGEKTPKSGALKPVHLILLEEALRQWPTPDRDSCLSNLARYLWGLNRREIYDEVVDAKLEHLRDTYPHWCGWRPQT